MPATVFKFISSMTGTTVPLQQKIHEKHSSSNCTRKKKMTIAVCINARLHPIFSVQKGKTKLIYYCTSRNMRRTFSCYSNIWYNCINSVHYNSGWNNIFCILDLLHTHYRRLHFILLVHRKRTRCSYKPRHRSVITLKYINGNTFSQRIKNECTYLEAQNAILKDSRKLALVPKLDQQRLITVTVS